MDCFNITISLCLCLIFVERTYDMCSYDIKPVWKAAESIEDLNLPCESDPNHTWYYWVIIISHIYFLLEFILRCMS